MATCGTRVRGEVTVPKGLGILCVRAGGRGEGRKQAHHQIQGKSPLLTGMEDALGGREDLDSVYAIVTT